MSEDKDERARFEAWCRENRKDLNLQHTYDSDGNYHYDGYIWEDTANALRLWQAALAAGQPAAQVRIEQLLASLPRVDINADGEAFINGRVHPEWDDPLVPLSAVRAMFTAAAQPSPPKLSVQSHWPFRGDAIDPRSELAGREVKPDSHWPAVTEANKLYAPLVKAAIDLLCAVDERHNTKDAPLKYAIPYGAINVLREALNTTPSTSAPAGDAGALLETLREALENLYTSLPDILPAGAGARFQKSGKWATGQAYGLRGLTGTALYRADDMECVYAAMDGAAKALAALSQQGQGSGS